MKEIVAALADQHAELDGLVADLDEAGWQRPSRCPGWSVADVLLHLAQSDELALASATGAWSSTALAPPGASEAPGSEASGARTVDDAAADAVARERGQPGAAVRDRWATGAAVLRRALDSCDPGQRVQWVAGRLSARTLATTRLAEAWIHTGDVADALGVVVPATDRLRPIARLAWRTLPYAFERAGRSLAGPVAFELRSPGGELWSFVPDEAPSTTVRGDALDLCLVAARRVPAAGTGLVADGPDAADVLELVRTYA